MKSRTMQSKPIAAMLYSCLHISLIAVALAGCTPSPAAVSAEQWCAKDATTEFKRDDLSLHSIAMVSPDEGWAVGRTNPVGGILLHYLNNQWSALTVEGAVDFQSVTMQSPQLGFATSDNNLVLQYDGTCWHTIHKGIRTLNGVYKRFNAISVASDGVAWVAGDGQIVRYSAGTWEQSIIPADVANGIPINSIFMFDDSIGWAVGGSERSEYISILKYKDNQWSAQTSPTQYSLNKIFMTSVDEGWAVGSSDIIYKSAILHYRGGVWNVEDMLDLWSLNGIYMLSPEEGWAVGDMRGYGVLLHWSNGQWIQEKIPAVAKLFDVTMVTPSNGWAVGLRGVILHYQNGAWSKWQQ